METGFKRNLLAELLDSVGRGVLLMALGIGWFVFLWGLNLPALLAGIALGTLLLLLRRLYRQTTLVRRETALRCRIGGELLLEKMLLSEAKEAHFQAALLLEEKWPLRMQRITADGALCRQEKPSGGAETLLVQCVRMPPEGELSIGQLVEAHRAMQRQQANRVILCVLGKAPPRVIARAEQMPTPIRVIRRETLLALAGGAFPRDGCTIGGAGAAKTENAAARQPAVYHDAAGKSTALLGLWVVHADTLYPHWKCVVCHAGDGLPDAVGRLPFRSGGGGAAVITSAAQSP